MNVTVLNHCDDEQRPRQARRSSLRENRGQRGETLIELLLTVFLMGTIVLSLLGLLLAVITSSAVHRATVSAGNQATTIAESIDRLPYLPCSPSNNPSAAYSAATSSAESGFTAQILSVKFLQSSNSATPSFESVCPGAGANDDQGAQLVRIQVKRNTAPGSKVIIDLVKRDQTCPVSGMAGQLQPNQQC